VEGGFIDFMLIDYLTKFKTWTLRRLKRRSPPPIFIYINLLVIYVHIFIVRPNYYSTGY